MFEAGARRGHVVNLLGIVDPGIRPIFSRQFKEIVPGDAAPAAGIDDLSERQEVPERDDASRFFDGSGEQNGVCR